MSTVKTKIGKRILFYRKKRSLTQLDLAKKSGLTQCMIALYEGAHREPPVSKLLLISKALGTSISDLVD